MQHLATVDEACVLIDLVVRGQMGFIGLSELVSAYKSDALWVTVQTHENGLKYVKSFLLKGGGTFVFSESTLRFVEVFKN